MALHCFLVEQVNVHTVVLPGRPACCDPARPDCVAVDGRDERHFDVRRADTGEVILTDVTSMRGLPAGAMYLQDVTERSRPTGPDDRDDWDSAQFALIRKAFADYPAGFPGPSDLDPTLPKRSPSHTFTDGLHLKVVLPGGHTWDVDSRASNCTLPYDYEHRCWVRTGEPPAVTAGKDGQTCSAGAGSIAVDSYHGFLVNGELTDHLG